MGFDSRSVTRNLGALIRADSNKGYSDVDDIENANQSLLGSMLGKAVSAYVNTQLEYCGDLEVKIAGSNRDILNGQLKMVKITAKQVVYKGIALSDVDLSASCLRVKLGRKRLLQNPLRVKASISIGENDLKASLTSPLLADYLKDILPEELSGAQGLAGVDVSLQDGIVLFTERQAVKHGCRSSNMRASVALSFEIMNGGKKISISNAGPYKQSNSNAIEKSLSVGSETSIKRLGVFGSRLVIGGEFYITP